MHEGVRVVTIFYETSSPGHVEVCRRIAGRQGFCRAKCRCRPPMAQLVKPVLAVGRRDGQQGPPPDCAEHEGDCCAEAAACPAMLGSKIPARTQRRGPAEGFWEVHVLLRRPTVVCSRALREEQGRYWCSPSSTHRPIQRWGFLTGQPRVDDSLVAIHRC